MWWWILLCPTPYRVLRHRFEVERYMWSPKGMREEESDYVLADFQQRTDIFKL